MVTVESFESGSLPSHFDGNTGAVSVSSGASWSGKDGTYYIESSDTSENAVNTTNTTVSQGETPIEMDFYFENEIGLSFGVQTTGDNSTYVGYTLVLTVNSFVLQTTDGGTEDTVGSVSSSVSTGQTVTLRVSQWTSSGDITVEAEAGGTVQESFSVTDSTYGAGGWGFEIETDGPVQYADNFRARKEPYAPSGLSATLQ